ncbi:hypothetical protein, partial [Nostoc sp. PA-18-2419]|uniref:hypothetical protein n=1 Tax=Nostoc sp. PA-18-2419 TaxID=2575443 RepID=UPI001107F0CF
MNSIETIEGMNLIKGYWDKTYSPSHPFDHSTLGIAFSGWAKPDQALSDSAKIKNRLVGHKYISLGGGDSDGNGSFTQEILHSFH